MAFFFLSLFTFIMFFQPVSVFPGMAIYSPYRYSAIIAFILFIVAGKKSDVHFLHIKNTQYFLLFIGMQTFSASTIWLYGGIDILNLWKNLAIIYYLIINFNWFKSFLYTYFSKRLTIFIYII